MTLLHLIFVLAYQTDLEPDLEMAPKYAAVQHDTPPPYREVDPSSSEVLLVDVDIDGSEE